MPANPAISVVMPVHNMERYVEASLNSVVAQTFAEFECIVVNDASTDGTAAIIERLASRDDRIVVVDVHARSAAEARNAGIARARAPYVALIDADDLAYPTRLDRQYAAAVAQPNVVLWGAAMRQITDEGLPMGVIDVGCHDAQAFYGLDRRHSLVRCYGTIAFFRRDVARAVGPFDRRYEPLEDSEMWDRMVAHGPALSLPDVLQDYRQHDQSLSVRKIARQSQLYRFLTHRYAERLAGREVDFGSFVDQEARRGRHVAWGDGLRAASMQFGRRAKIAWVRRRYALAVTNGTLSFLVHPIRFLRRLFPNAPHV